MKSELKKYDVVLIDFGSKTIGSEQGGKRPAVIIQNDLGNIHSPSTIVFPITSVIKKPHQPTHTLIKRGAEKGLSVDSMVLGEAMRQVSEERIVKYLGKITSDEEKKEIKRVYLANFGE